MMLGWKNMFTDPTITEYFELDPFVLTGKISDIIKYLTALQSDYLEIDSIKFRDYHNDDVETTLWTMIKKD